MTITTTRRELDTLASQIQSFILDPDNEDTFLCVRHPQTRLALLVQVPNRHEDPANFFRVTSKDFYPLSKFGFTLLGMIHTHTMRGEDGPSDPDIEKATPNYPSGVYKIGTDRVIWYTPSGVIHTSRLVTTEAVA